MSKYDDSFHRIMAMRLKRAESMEVLVQASVIRNRLHEEDKLRARGRLQAMLAQVEQAEKKIDEVEITTVSVSTPVTRIRS